MRTTSAIAAPIALVALATSACGCGLVLDAWPPDPVVDPDDASFEGMDAGRERDAGTSDATEPDARQRQDASGVVVDASPSIDAAATFVDAAPLVDAFLAADAADVPDAFRPIDASDIDAFVESDAGATPDASLVDAATVVCSGVPPMVGPPRTCELGSCLCFVIDECFAADVVRACCADGYACAPPAADCMATHPIVGPPRTCDRGSCYCGNPDACFPADRADRCCGVDVVCVP